MKPDIKHTDQDIKVSDDKRKLRMQLQSTLADLSADQMIQKSKKACQNLVSTQQFQDASVIMMYLTMAHETDVSDAILRAWQLGKTVLVPSVSWKHRQMTAVQINSLETDFDTNVGGLRNPLSGTPFPLELIDLIVAPGLGFDGKGNRLGRGASYYDCFFAREQLKAKRCGFAFEEQVVALVPIAEHDEQVDFLVTDERVLYIKTD